MKLLERLLYEPRHEKEKCVTDRTLNRSVAISVVGILFCVTCLIGLTWAWFSSSVTTGSNKITAANFDVEITVTEQGTEDAVPPKEDGYYILNPDKTYTVSLVKQGAATAGFCHLSVMKPSADIATAYYTDSIPRTGAATPQEADSFTFTLSGVAKIKITPMWGSCPETQESRIVSHDGTLSVGAVSSAHQAPPPEESKTDDPEPEEPEENSSDATTGSTAGTTAATTDAEQTTAASETDATTEATGTEPTTVATSGAQATEPTDTEAEPTATAPSEQAEP